MEEEEILGVHLLVQLANQTKVRNDIVRYNINSVTWDTPLIL